MEIADASDDGSWPSRAGRGLALVLLALVGVTLLWWAVGRIAAGGRAPSVHRWEAPSPAAKPGPPPAGGAARARAPDDAVRAAGADSAGGARIRVLAWNLAHGRGDVGPGLFRNYRGGSEEERIARLARIAAVLRRADADVVVLNEVDFRSSWSGGLNQAEVLARAAGYGTWVQQKNYDVRLPFAVFSFGNAVLTRLPVRGARPVGLPPHSSIEALAAGAKTASVVELDTPLGAVSVVPVHLEPRGGATRRAALPVHDSLRRAEAPPLLLAGDFNASPPGWPRAAHTSAVGELLERGWRSARARGAPVPGELTHPTPEPRKAIDWILAEPPLWAAEARVFEADPTLSDHAPVLAVIRRAEP